MENEKELDKHYPGLYSVCEIYGHDFVPELGFDNVIIDYRCRVCSVLESDINN